VNGDGFVRVADGSARWGRFGAAGVLARHEDRYFVAQRSLHCHQGGTWAIPGGALDSHESPLEGALREFREEIGHVLDDFHVAIEHEDDHGGWSYWTIVIDVPEPFDLPTTLHWETAAVAWMTIDELDALELHDAFRATLIRLGLLPAGQGAPVKIGWLLHPDLKPLLDHGAPVFLAAICAIVFAESGLLIGFFLPGDSLLFSAGLVLALNDRSDLLVVMLPLVFIAAALGDQVGYMFGAKVGPSLFTRPDSRLFKQENVTRSHEFFERHGARALVLARFVPIVRTFTPILAGVSTMRYRTFLAFNLVGALLWSSMATLIGYGLGDRFPKLESYLTPILLVIVLLSVIPMLFEIRKARRDAR
jgi:membrane protein DedA with SNARE-associated domain/8-oxo-dGTP pyrophosphatase MutT (NUDIX family)